MYFMYLRCIKKRWEMVLTKGINWRFNSIGGELVKTPRVTWYRTFSKRAWLVKGPRWSKTSGPPVLRVAVQIGPIMITCIKSRISWCNYPLAGELHSCWPLTARYQYLRIQHVCAIHVYSPSVPFYRKRSVIQPSFLAANWFPVLLDGEASR